MRSIPPAQDAQREAAGMEIQRQAVRADRSVWVSRAPKAILQTKQELVSTPQLLLDWGNTQTAIAAASINFSKHFGHGHHGLASISLLTDAPQRSTMHF